TTFGGGALVTAVALKVMEIMERDGLVQRAGQVGSRARARFWDLASRMPGVIRDVRGLGLLIGIQLEIPQEKAQQVWSSLLEKGFILNLTYGSTLRLLPPLNIAERDLEDFTAALEDVLKKVF
ncbi:MAG: aminotransferase class III-fold pyridoxal phosphate-dependent enzyme, partial [Mailhella sp.]|nr:aminotransferase class III-fold pyridoxal phosphate-dependent enzyme [Mailhella sp.]